MTPVVAMGRWEVDGDEAICLRPASGADGFKWSSSVVGSTLTSLILAVGANPGTVEEIHDGQPQQTWVQGGVCIECGGGAWPGHPVGSPKPCANPVLDDGCGY